MKVVRIVRSKWLYHYIFAAILCMMLALGYLIQGYLPFGPFGEPDPTAIFIPVIMDSFMIIFWARSYLLYITDKVYTIRGNFRVHSRAPIAVFDPLKYVKFNKVVNLSPEALAALTKLVEEKHGPGTPVEQKHMHEILMPRIKEFRDREYKKYLGNKDYDKLVNGVMLQEYREDGGSWQFGRRGAKARGNAVLVNPIGMVRNYGTDAILYTNIENYWGIDLFGFELNVRKAAKTGDGEANANDDLTNEILEQIEIREKGIEYEVVRFLGLPHYILFAVMDLNPNFKLGDHMVCYGTEPLHMCVRALVEDNEWVEDKELQSRPRWIWGFPAIVANANPDARINYIKELNTKLTNAITNVSNSYDRVKEVEEKATGKEEPKPIEPVPVDESGKEVEQQ